MNNIIWHIPNRTARQRGLQFSSTQGTVSKDNIFFEDYKRAPTSAPMLCFRELNFKIFFSLGELDVLEVSPGSAINILLLLH